MGQRLPGDGVSVLALSSRVRNRAKRDVSEGRTPGFSTRSIESCEESSRSTALDRKAKSFSTRSIESCEESSDLLVPTLKNFKFQYSLYRVV